MRSGMARCGTRDRVESVHERQEICDDHKERTADDGHKDKKNLEPDIGEIA